MNQLETFTVNPFMTIIVRRARIQKFVFDHIHRMQTANLPAYAQLIVDTTAIYEQIFGNIELYDATLNEQVSYSRQLKETGEQFTAKVVELEPLVMVKFRKPNPVYYEFYPHGLTEYHSIPQDYMEVLMDRMISKSDTYSADIGVTWKNDFTNLKNTWITLFGSQRDRKALVDQTASAFDTLRTPLFVQLFKNMATILAVNAAEPTNMLDFYDQTIVNFESHVHELTVPHNSRAASDITYTTDDALRITNKSSKMLHGYFAPDPDALPPQTLYDFPANAKTEIECNTINLPDDKVLIFINDNDEDCDVAVLKI